MDFIDRFIKAWNDKDIDSLKNTLSNDFKGARVYTEDIFYKKADFISYVTQNKQQIKVKKAYETNGVYFLKATLDKTKLEIKITTKDNKIVKYYEMLRVKTNRYLCDISYDGTKYFGFQKQPNERSIQSEIEHALSQAFNMDITIHASGRTDKGVHAIHQMIHFDLDIHIPSAKIPFILNHILPKDIIIHQAYKVPSTFHARYDVIKKTYQYKIYVGDYNPFEANYMMHHPSFDVSLFENVLKQFLGTHDFYNFTKNRDVDTIRTIYDISITKKGGFITILITGSGFLRYMVRYIIGAALEIVSGKAKYTIKEALEKKDKAMLKHLAEPNGLYLYNVDYKEDLNELSTFDL